MSTTYTVGVRIDGNVASYLRATRQAEQATRGMGSVVKAEFTKIRQFWQSYQGQLAGLGLGAGFIQAQRNAAGLEKTLTQVRLTAGMSVQEQQEGYRRMFALVRQNGGVMEDTVGGFNNLIQAGLKYQEAMKATEAISVAKAVTGASEQALSGGLTVGSANFGFDLAKAGVARQMLDEMTVAGRLGNAELENLSDIFSRVAQRAQSAGMSFQTTLAFIEGLSQIERQPERLATLADSTLRLFTNAHYAKDAEKATGIKFFAQDGSRRDSIAVLEEMRAKFQKLTTDAQRFQFVNKAFGKADLDTQRGLSALLGGSGLQNIRDFERLIKNAGGTLERDLPTAVGNAADQASRLKNTLREAAEEFARPINEAISNVTQHLLDGKEKGGLNLSGGQVAGGAALGAVGVYAASRLLPTMLRSMAGRFGGVGAGVATGKALEAAAGVTPVYVTNWAEMGGAGQGVGSAAGAAAGGAAGGALLSRVLSVARWGGGVGLAAGGGYLAGTALHKGVLEGTAVSNVIGRGVANVLAFFGNKEAAQSVNAEWALDKAMQRPARPGAPLPDSRPVYRALSVDAPNRAAEELERAIKRSEFKGEVTVRVTSAPGVGVDADVMFTNPRIPLRADVGRTNLAAGY